MIHLFKNVSFPQQAVQKTRGYPWTLGRAISTLLDTRPAHLAPTKPVMPPAAQHRPPHDCRPISAGQDHRAMIQQRVSSRGDKLHVMARKHAQHSEMSGFYHVFFAVAFLLPPDSLTILQGFQCTFGPCTSRSVFDLLGSKLYLKSPILQLIIQYSNPKILQWIEKQIGLPTLRKSTPKIHDEKLVKAGNDGEKTIELPAMTWGLTRLPPQIYLCIMVFPGKKITLQGRKHQNSQHQGFEPQTPQTLKSVREF